MFLERRTDSGWVVGCECPHGGRFTVRRLGIAVECPQCGRTALSSDLTTDYWLRTKTHDIAFAA